jgi:hypothetical protein
MVLEIVLSFIVFVEFVVIVCLVRSFKISLENQGKKFDVFSGDIMRLILDMDRRFQTGLPVVIGKSVGEYCLDLWNLFIKRYNTIVDRFNRKG